MTRPLIDGVAIWSPGLIMRRIARPLAISVATGHFSTEQLREAGGEMVFDSFEDFSPLLDRLMLNADALITLDQMGIGTTAYHIVAEKV